MIINHSRTSSTVMFLKGGFGMHALRLVAVLSCFQTLEALGETKVWIGDDSINLWQTPSNWSGGTVPNSGDDVIIYDFAIITSMGSVTINNLTIFSSTFLVGLSGGVTAVQGTFTSSGGYFEVRGIGMTLDLLGPVHVAGSFVVDSGAVVRAPWLRSYHPGGYGNQWWVGTGSVLDLSGLTNIVGSDVSGYPNSFDTQGGKLLMSNLVTSTMNVAISAVGTGSVVDLSSLERHTGGRLDFQTGNDATVLLPRLATAHGMFVAAQNCSLDLPSLTNFDNSILWVQEEAVVRLPALHSYVVATNDPRMAWGVAGVLDMPALTNIAGVLDLYVSGGGHVLLTNLVTWSDQLSVLAYEAGSIVDLSALRHNFAEDSWLSLWAWDGSTIVAPHLATGANVNVSAGGTNTSVILTSVTNFDGGTLSAGDGAIVTLPALSGYNTGHAVNWLVSGPGSVLDLPVLTQVIGPSCCTLNLRAHNGGELRLPNVATIQDGSASVISDGTNSLVDLSKLSGFVVRSGAGELIATNGGTLLLNEQALLLGNVALSIGAGHPFLPAVLAASPTLTLFGNAWDSYAVEKRDTSSTDGPWALASRVPLTSTSQALASSVPPDTNFRVVEFVADPPLLDLWRVGSGGVKLVLFGANKNYRVESTGNLADPITWTTESHVSMTNSFRIFPSNPTTEPARFYRTTQEE
jgi:hypothetical protein